MTKDNNLQNVNNNEDSSIVINTGSGAISIDEITEADDNKHRKSQRTVLTLTDEMFSSAAQHNKHHKHHKHHHHRISSHLHSHHSSHKHERDYRTDVINLEDDGNSKFKAAASIKKSEGKVAPIKVDNTIRIKKSDKPVEYSKPNKNALNGDEDKTLLYTSGMSIVDVVDSEPAKMTSGGGLSKVFYKNYYKFKKKRLLDKQNKKHMVIETFIIRVVEIWSLLLLSNFIVFFIKPIFNRVINGLFENKVSDNMLLTFRYIPVWILVALVSIVPTYRLGFRDPKFFDKISYKRITGIFASAFLLYVAVAVFFMDFLNPLPLMGALSVNGSYIAALVTGARNLKQLVGSEFRPINTLSISATLLITIIPMYMSFVKGAKQRIYIRNKGKLPKSKKLKKVFVLETRDESDIHVSKHIQTERNHGQIK